MTYDEDPNIVVTRRLEVRRAGSGGGGGGGAGGAGGGGGAARARLGRVRRVCGGWRETASEACGTALLVALSCLPAALAAPAAPAPAPLLQRGLTSGLVVTVVVQCFDHISGAQVNPTVTLASLLYGRCTVGRAIANVCAQLAGACLGHAALLLLLAPPAPCCLTEPGPHVSPYQAVVLEGVASAALALANCAGWDARTAPYRDSWPVRIGAIVAALTLLTGDATGASLNPARSLAPALLASRWDNHWVYWVGPLTGSAVITALYVAVWRQLPAPAPHPARAPHPSRAPPAFDDPTPAVLL